MEIFYFIVSILLALSITKMWSDSDIFRPIRNYISDVPAIRKPFLCPKCMSFWFAVLVALVIYNPFSVMFNVPIILSHACFGLIVHYIACFLIDHNLF